MTRRGRPIEVLLLLLAGGLFVFGFAWRADASAFDPERAFPNRLRVATWNVGQASGDGGGALLVEQEQHVLERLGELDADLVLLQELSGRAQSERILTALGDAWSALASLDGEGRTTALFARRARLEPLPRARLQGLGARGVVARLRFEGGGHAEYRLAVAGVHADAFSPRRRNTLLGRVRTQLDEFSAGYPRLMAGDFNIDLDPEVRRDLFSDDAYLDVQTYNALLAPGNGAPGLFDACVDGGPTAEPDRRLDYILTEPGALRVLQSGPWRGARAAGMDHDPVLADLRLELSE